MQFSIVFENSEFFFEKKLNQEGQFVLLLEIVEIPNLFQKNVANKRTNLCYFQKHLQFRN